MRVTIRTFLRRNRVWLRLIHRIKFPSKKENKKHKKIKKKKQINNCNYNLKVKKIKKNINKVGKDWFT